MLFTVNCELCIIMVVCYLLSVLLFAVRWLVCGCMSRGVAVVYGSLCDVGCSLRVVRCLLFDVCCLR